MKALQVGGSAIIRTECPGLIQMLCNDFMATPTMLVK